MRSFVVCYLQRVRESSEQKTPCSLAPGCFGQIGRPGFQDSTSCTNAAHIFGEPQLIKQMPLMIIFYFSAHLLSLPSRGAWIEIFKNFNSGRARMSLPSRGAWIEMETALRCGHRPAVAPLTGSVDRNHFSPMPVSLLSWVAPLTGSVDRNNKDEGTISLLEVAPLTGSVDRNCVPRAASGVSLQSLPSRGAWIEIKSPNR